MNCTDAKHEMLAYLYGENDDIELRRHFADCSSCAQEIAAMATVKGILSEITVPAVNPVRRRRLGLVRPISWAALVLCGFIGGWLVQFLPTAKTGSADEILRLLAHNQQYRDSLSQGQLLAIQQMEKRLAGSAQLARQVERLHHQENLARNGQIAQCISYQRRFLEDYQDSPLAEFVRCRLARNLSTTRNYRQAAECYRRLLLSPLLGVQQRGEYLWQLAQSYRHSRQWSQYYNLLGELESEPAYRLFHWRAVKEMADADFVNCRFIQARKRYDQYRQSGLADVGDALRHISWIDYHEKDNFYPLVLLVQAQQQGIDAFYGLRIILRQYPDSPVAQSAFRTYLRSDDLLISGEKIPAFPDRLSSPRMLTYLSQVADMKELQEVASYADYWRANLLRESGKLRQAAQIYRRLVHEVYGPLQDSVRNRLERLTTLIANQRRT